MNPQHQQKRKICQSCCLKLYLRPSFIAFFNFSHKRPTFAFTVESGYTHSPSPTGSHTTAHTAKQGAFRTGALSLPSTRAAHSRTSPGRVSERQTLPLLSLGRRCSRRTQRACGTAMRLCASLSRRRRGPAGLRDPIAVSLHRGTPRFWSTVITECREKHTSFLCTELFCQLCLRLPPLCCTL